MIIGSGGSGKSTLSFKLAEQLNLPIYHTDKIYRKPNWKETSEAEYTQKIKEISAKEKWIIDGNNKSTYYLRMPRADLIIYTDYPPLLCLYRAVRRAIKADHRPDMAEGCIEQFSLLFYKYILTFRQKKRPIILESIKKYKSKDVDFIQIKSNQELESFLSTFQ